LGKTVLPKSMRARACTLFKVEQWKSRTSLKSVQIQPGKAGFIKGHAHFLRLSSGNPG